MKRLLFLCLLVSLSSIAQGWAQQRERERQPIQGKGKLQGVGQGVLQVVGEKGEQWLVAVGPMVRDVHFVGTGTQAILRPGMLVQFRATLDKKGEAQEAIGEINVVSPREGLQLGLQSDAGGLGGGLFNSKDEEPNKKKKKVRNEGGAYFVTGTLRSIKDGKMYVAAGAATIKAELTDNCPVNLDVTDLGFARIGDSVELNGWHYAGQSAQIHANRLTVTADKLIGVAEESKKRKPTAKSTEKAADEKPAEEKNAAPKKDEMKG